MKYAKQISTFFVATLAAVAALAGPAEEAAQARAQAALSLETLMNQHRESRALTVDWQRDIEPVLRADASLLDAHLVDKSSRVRERAVAMLGTTGDRAKSVDTRRAIVERLVTAAADDEALVHQRACRLLVRFDSDDYTDVSRDGLRALYRDNPRRSAHVLAVGAAQLKDLAPELAESAKSFDPDSARWRRSAAWAAMLARARMGFGDDVDRVVQQAATMKDEHSRFTQLSYQLAFVRQPAALEALRDMLMSDERAPEIHPGPGMPYSEFALDALTRVFTDFPVAEKSPGRYTPGELRAARSYMRGWGTIKR